MQKRFLRVDADQPQQKPPLLPPDKPVSAVRDFTELGLIVLAILGVLGSIALALVAFNQ